MMIKDHVSLAGFGGVLQPLVGPNLSEMGPRFPPISMAYTYALRLHAAQTALELGLEGRMREGTYVYVSGPSFESRAEARFLRDMVGADCVGRFIIV